MEFTVHLSGRAMWETVQLFIILFGLTLLANFARLHRSRPVEPLRYAQTEGTTVLLWKPGITHDIPVCFCNA